MANGKEVKKNAFLDRGSTTTLCDERLVDALGLSGEPVTFSLSTLNRVSEKQHRKKVQLDVAPINGGDVLTLVALTLDCLEVTKNPSIDAIDLQRWNHLCDLHVPILPDEDILLLVGVNVSHAFWTLEERRGYVGEPFAVRTLLGWSLMGSVLASAGKTLAVHHVTTADEVLEHNVKRLWQLDAIPLPNPSGVSMSKEDRYALSVMKQSKSKVNGHYQISLPWRPHGDTFLKNNRQLAKTRLTYLQKRLDKDWYLKAKYTEADNRYLSEGHVRLVSDKDTEAVWFLPHHPVTHPSKPGKVKGDFR